jgi:dihydrofolate reductase
MRKLILKMSVSIDGFVAGPNREIDWIFRSTDDEATTWTVESLWQTGVHIMGSRTFRDMAAYWPTSSEPFAAPMNEIPKAYFSSGGEQSTTRALEDATARIGSLPPASARALESWDAARVVTGDLAEEVARLKQEPGKSIVAHGGATFAQSLVKSGLVDEYRLVMHPVVLGTGLPLFGRLHSPLDLTLLEATRFASGAVGHVYRNRGQEPAD